MSVWEEGKTVLLVLGYPALRGQLSRFVQNTGHKVLAASSGKEGLQIAREHPGSIDLVVSEFHPPDMASTELLTALRQSRPGIPAIVLSSEPEEVLVQTFGYPGISFLETPFSWSLLADRMSDALS